VQTAKGGESNERERERESGESYQKIRCSRDWESGAGCSGVQVLASVLRADDARLAHQAVPVVAAERDQGAHGEAPLAQAGAPDAPVERRHWHHALDDWVLPWVCQ